VTTAVENQHHDSIIPSTVCLPHCNVMLPPPPWLLLTLLPPLLLLQLSDIKKSITKVPTVITDTAGGSKLLAHELFTNDVLYAEAALDMSGMPAHLLPLVPLFCRSLTQVRGFHCVWAVDLGSAATSQHITPHRVALAMVCYSCCTCLHCCFTCPLITLCPPLPTPPHPHPHSLTHSLTHSFPCRWALRRSHSLS
jgi:hypothetical protein